MIDIGNEEMLIFGSSSRYIQGPGAIKYLGKYAELLSRKKKVFVLLDRGTQFLKDKVEKLLKEEGIDYSIDIFDGEVILKKADKLSEEIKSNGETEIILGIGGGKTLDMSRLIAGRLDIRNIIVPTIAATDAPISHQAIASDEDHEVIVEENFLSPELVLVDSEIIVSAPVRYFVSGIGDAISKKYEVRKAILSGENNAFGGKQVYFLEPLLDFHHDILIKYSNDAKESVEKKETNETVEKVITSIILLSGLLFENGGLIGAHIIAEVLNIEGFGKKNMHGELVAVGVLLQIILEDMPDQEFAVMHRLFRDLGLPVNFSDLGIRFGNRKEVSDICNGISLKLEKFSFIRSKEQIEKAAEILEKK